MPFAAAEFFISSQFPTPGLVDAWNKTEAGLGTAILRLTVEHGERTMRMREAALRLEEQKLSLVDRQLSDDIVISKEKLGYLERQSKRGYMIASRGQFLTFTLCLIVSIGAMLLLWQGRSIEGLAALVLALGTPAAVVGLTKMYDVKTSERLSKESEEALANSSLHEHEAVEQLMGQAPPPAP